MMSLLCILAPTLCVCVGYMGVCGVRVTMYVSGVHVCVCMCVAYYKCIDEN